MNLIGKIFEIGYLIITIVFAYEAYSNWVIDREKAIIFIVLSVLALFMFFFRRKTRIRRENYFKNKN